MSGWDGPPAGCISTPVANIRQATASLPVPPAAPVVPVLLEHSHPNPLVQRSLVSPKRQIRAPFQVLVSNDINPHRVVIRNNGDTVTSLLPSDRQQDVSIASVAEETHATIAVAIFATGLPNFLGDNSVAS